MAEVDDIEKMVKEARAWIIEGSGAAAGIRTFDGVAELLVEVIRELRRLNENIEGLKKPES